MQTLVCSRDSDVSDRGKLVVYLSSGRRGSTILPKFEIPALLQTDFLSF